MVEAVDSSVGRILETLDELDLAESTLVIFSSDNGGTNVSINEPLRGVKGSLYEGGIRVPTCMAWPGVIAPGSESHTPISSVDFLPTFAELAGVPLPDVQPVDGESFAPILRQQAALEDRAIFWHYPLYLTGRATPASAVRKGDWKLIEFFEDRRLEMYNIANDIGESRNMAGYRAREGPRVAPRADRLAQGNECRGAARAEPVLRRKTEPLGPTYT